MMHMIEPLLSDSAFWIAAALFLLSIGGVVWILRLMHKPETETITSFEPFPGAVAPPAPPPPAAVLQHAPELKLPVPTANKATIESLSERLDKIEDTLTILAVEIKQANLAARSAPGDELKNALDAIRAQLASAPQGPQDQVGQLSAKVDKIYQVLTSLSGTAQ